MEKENVRDLKAVILESKKTRTERGENFFDNRKSIIPDSTSKIHDGDDKNEMAKVGESHAKLSQLIGEYEGKIFAQNSQVLKIKKPRSKSIHLYIDETIEHFLQNESKKVETQWGLRKNAGLGQLIQKFLLNFIELKKREERQLKRVKKVINDFRTGLVEFKKLSGTTSEYKKAEEVNQRMKVLSNDLRILLSLLEFEESELKTSLGLEEFNWINFVIQWKYSQGI